MNNSFDLILPFLRPIQDHILDEEISEIMVNADGRIFVERAGLMDELVGVRISERGLEAAVRNIARGPGRRD